MPTIDLRGGKSKATAAEKAAQKYDLAYEAAQREYRGRQIREGMAREKAAEAAKKQQEKASHFTNYNEAIEENKRRVAMVKRAERERTSNEERTRKQAILEQRRAERAQLREQQRAEALTLRDQKRAERTTLREQQRAEALKLADQKRAERVTLREQQRAENQRLASARKAAKQSTQQDQRDALERTRVVATLRRNRSAGFDKDYEAAHSENFKRMWEDAQSENRAWNLAHQPPGGGRGGAGGGRGGNGGYGAAAMGGGFLGGGIVGLLKKHPVTAGALAVGAGIVETILAPAQIMRMLLSVSDDYRRIRKGALGMGMSGGFYGPELFRDLAANKTGFAKLGLTPDMFLESMNTFGIVPRSSAQAQQYGTAFRRQSLLPGFSGMGTGTAEEVARQGAGYGLTSGPQGVENYLNRISATMEDAIAKGMDRAKVLDSIQGSIESIAKSGAIGVSVEGVRNLIARFGASGLPSGMTGEAAGRVISTEAQKNGQPFSDMQRQFILSSEMLRYNNLSTEEDVLKAIGKDNADAALKLKASNPKLYKQQMGDVLGAGSGFLRSAATQDLFMGAAPQRAAELVGSYADRNYPNQGYIKNLLIKRETGASGPEAEAYRLYGNARAPGGRSRASQDALLGGKNIPADAFKTETTAAKTILQSSEQAYNVLEPIAGTFATAVSAFNKGVETFVRGLNNRPVPLNSPTYIDPNQAFKDAGGGIEGWLARMGASFGADYNIAPGLSGP